MGRRSRVTICDIANRLGISHATVSTALTGRRNGTFVSDQTRRRIWATAREMGYRLKHLRAREPVLKRVVLFCAPGPFYHTTIMQVLEGLNRQGFQALVHAGVDDGQGCRLARELDRRNEIDAAIFVGSRHRAEDLPGVGLPFVVVGDVPEGVPVWRVTQDNEGGGRAVGEHLWSLGHRRVGMLLAPQTVFGQKRLRGLQSVWRDHGMDFPADWVLGQLRTGHNLTEGLPRFLREARRKRGPLTALFCYGDGLAASVLQALWQAGVRVPDQMSVVGFDDQPYAASLVPPLTTVTYPRDELGPLATQLLLERMRNPYQPPRVVTVGVRVVVRGSTAPPCERRKAEG